MKVCRCTDSCGCYISDNLTVGTIIPINKITNDIWNDTSTQWKNVIPKPIQPTLKEKLSDYSIDELLDEIKRSTNK